MTGRLARTTRCALVLVGSLMSGSMALADDYADARAELVAAYQAGDYATMITAAEKSVLARPGFPGAMFNLALANVLHGNPQAALGNLTVLLNNGVDFGVDQMDEFAALKELPDWQEYRRRVAKLNEPVGNVETALQLGEGDFVPEGIAVDEDGNFFLGSIRKGRLLRGDEVLTDRQGHWSVFGMRFHEDGSLWFASAAVAQLDGVGEDEGKTGLFRLDTRNGRITQAGILPQFADKQVLGDLVIAGDTIYTTDSLTGAVYRYDIETGEFEALVERGTFGSPQGLVLDAAGQHLYVADYIGGLYQVSVGDGQVEKVMVTPLGTDYGIDGLYRHGDKLIAIQNGIRPHRVAAFRLNAQGPFAVFDRILAANLPEFDEPTLGTVRGDDFYFVANSHWNRFDRENRLPEGLSGPTILKLPLIEK